MPRSYGEKFLRGLADGDPASVGVQLGRACVEANLPAAYVARVMGVARMTIYKWFRGHSITEKNLRTIAAFMRLIDEDMKNGVLPVRNLKDAKQYLEHLAGVTL